LGGDPAKGDEDHKSRSAPVGRDNITESLPIVFALQNLTAAAALGPFSFSWDAMPYGNVGENQEPSGVTNDGWTATFVAANTTTEPYIFVNQTGVQKWRWGPYYPDGSVYALQWYIKWDVTIEPCDSDPLGVFGEVFFNINIGDIEPDLENLVGKCPQLGGVYEFNMTALNSSCSAVVSSNGTSDPCAITVHKAMVGSISRCRASLQRQQPLHRLVLPTHFRRHCIILLLAPMFRYDMWWWLYSFLGLFRW
jgi:hypothetical protein